MNAPTIYDCEQRSVEWYEARRGIVTASMVGKLITSTLKVASNDTSRGVIALLAAERITGVVEDTYTSDAMMRGILDEPLAREHYRTYRNNVAEVGFMRRETEDYTLGASPDGLVGKDGLIEVKSAEPKIHLARILGAPIDHNHMAQMQAQMLVSGRSWCDYISWCGGLPMWVQRVTADPDWFVAIHEAVVAAENAIDHAVVAFDELTEGLPSTTRINHFAQPELKL